MNTNTYTQQDTAGSAAYVMRPGGPPDNRSYLIAAYSIAFVLYGGYIVLLLRRIARERAIARSLQTD